MQTLVGSFSLVDVSRFRALLEKQGFRFLNEEFRSLPTGKTLWLGIFSSAAIGPDKRRSVDLRRRAG
jgi:hypothetical protein